MVQDNNTTETGLIGGVEKRAVEIADYDLLWPVRFAKLATQISSGLSGLSHGLEHIGSTSVPGLAAKPIIDMLLIVPDAAVEAAYLPVLQSLGYQLRVREPEFYEHRMVRTPARDVHVHVFSEGCPENERYVLFRDYLRLHPAQREAYAALKRELAQKEWADMNAYAAAKTAFVERIIQLARDELI